MASRKNLPAETVIDIFTSLGQQKEVARRFSVSMGTVHKIKRQIIHRATTVNWQRANAPSAVNAMLITAAFVGAP